MKIKTIKNRMGRDFDAVYQCEHCGHEYEDIGYDDDHFRTKVVPVIQCPKCQRRGSNAGEEEARP